MIFKISFLLSQKIFLNNFRNVRLMLKTCHSTPLHTTPVIHLLTHLLIQYKTHHQKPSFSQFVVEKKNEQKIEKNPPNKTERRNIHTYTHIHTKKTTTIEWMNSTAFRSVCLLGNGKVLCVNEFPKWIIMSCIQKITTIATKPTKTKKKL